jgi:hypothetical protein
MDNVEIKPCPFFYQKERRNEVSDYKGYFLDREVKTIDDFEAKYNKNNSTFAETIHDDLHSWYEVLECDFDWIVAEVKRLNLCLSNKRKDE